MAGAGEHHLASCLRAPYTDFRGHELNEDPKVDLSWGRIFSEAKLAEKLISSFPFRLAPCQVWDTPAPSFPVCDEYLLKRAGPSRCSWP
jgi:hypothetical protein